MDSVELTGVSVCLHSTPPDNLSIQEFQKNEAIDVEVKTWGFYLHDYSVINYCFTLLNSVISILGSPTYQHRDFTFCQFHPQRLCGSDHDYAQQRFYSLTVSLIHR